MPVEHVSFGDLLLRHAPKGKTIIDGGCGDNFGPALFLAQNGRKVVALDHTAKIVGERSQIGSLEMHKVGMAVFDSGGQRALERLKSLKNTGNVNKAFEKEIEDLDKRIKNRVRWVKGNIHTTDFKRKPVVLLNGSFSRIDPTWHGGTPFYEGGIEPPPEGWFRNLLNKSSKVIITSDPQIDNVGLEKLVEKLKEKHGIDEGQIQRFELNGGIALPIRTGWGTERHKPNDDTKYAVVVTPKSK